MIWLQPILLALVASAAAAQSFTPEEQEVLDKFRPMVSPLLYRDFMKNDDYLMKWLKAKNMDADAAKAALQKTVEWRKAEKMDEADTEDVSRAEKCMKVFSSGHDRRGRPIFYVPIGHWDIRKCALAGLMPDMIRYLLTRLYEPMQNAIENATDPTGAGNVTQAYVIVDLQGFNLRQSGCLQCIPLFVAMASPTENYYPGIVYKFMIVNSPSTWEVVFSAVSPLVSKQTRESFKILGHDKDEWGPKLKDDVAPDQLFTVYGGTKRLTKA